MRPPWLLTAFSASLLARVPLQPLQAGRQRVQMMSVDTDGLDPSRDCPWEIVGAPRTATKEEVRKAYRRRARTLHPDVSTDPEAGAKFRRLVAAFEVLSDENRRVQFESQRKRSSARSRAQRAWDDLNRRASDSASTRNAGGSTSAQRPAGSRREAEARTREESDRRRERWREISFEEVVCT